MYTYIYVYIYIYIYTERERERERKIKHVSVYPVRISGFYETRLGFFMPYHKWSSSLYCSVESFSFQLPSDLICDRLRSTGVFALIT